jgi:hypothetical protein
MITIERKQMPPVYNLTLEQCSLGKAYEDCDGDVYICHDRMNLVSFCGRYSFNGHPSAMMFREVNVTVTVHST